MGRGEKYLTELLILIHWPPGHLGFTHDMEQNFSSYSASPFPQAFF